MDEVANGELNDKDLTNKIEKTIEKVATAEATAKESEIKGNKMVGEGGAQQTLNTYNNMQQEKRYDERQ